MAGTSANVMITSSPAHVLSMGPFKDLPTVLGIQYLAWRVSNHQCICGMQTLASGVQGEELDLKILEATQPLLQQVDQLTRQLASERDSHTASLAQMRKDLAAAQESTQSAANHAQAREEAAVAAAEATGSKLVAAVEARQQEQSKAETLAHQFQTSQRKLKGCERERNELLDQLTSLQASKGEQVEVRSASCCSFSG